MTCLVYYVAASEDGFIAGPNGALDWLHRFESPDEDYGYGDFIASIDGLVLGRATYELSRSFGPWPYGERPAWLLTHHPRETWPELPNTVRACAEKPQALCAEWRALGLGRVWLVGGGAVAADYAAAGLIDELVLTTVPVRLGEGVGLFGPQPAMLATTMAAFTPGPPTPLANGLVQRRWTRSPGPLTAAPR